MKLFILVLALVGCAGATRPATAQRGNSVAEKAEREYKVDRETDAFTKVKTVTIGLRTGRDAYRDISCGGSSTPYLGMGLQQRTDTAKTGLYLFVVYAGSDWLFIDKGESLKTLLGDSVKGFSSLQETQRDVKGGLVFESMAYEVDLDDLRTLVLRDSIRARITGRSSSCDFTITPAALELIRLFMVRELGDSTSARRTP